MKRIKHIEHVKRGGTSVCSVLALFFLGATAANAITYDPFGPNGEGGDLHGQSVLIGTGGTVFEIDAYLNIAGEDLNGGFFGTSAQLSMDPLPIGLDYSFASSLSADSTDLTLSYTFANSTGADIAGVQFLSYLDADIDAAANGPFNEYAATSGSLPTGQGFEVDEPTGVFPPILDHLLLGALTDVNLLPFGTPGNVAMALSWDLGTLLNGESTTVDVMMSEDGSSLGGFSIRQSDMEAGSQTNVTYSGEIRQAAVVAEPPALALLLLGAVTLGLSRRLSITR